MKLTYLLLFFLLPNLSIATEIVPTQMQCDTTKKITNSLLSVYKENPIIIGVASDGASSIMTLWVNTSTKSWTILATKGDVSCVIGHGSELKLITSSPYI